MATTSFSSTPLWTARVEVAPLGQALLIHGDIPPAVARTPDFLTLAGTVKVPASLRNVAWDDIVRKTRATQAAKHA